MKSIRIAGLLAVALFLAAWLAWTPRSRADNDDTWADLHGTWVVAATPGDVVVCGGGPKVSNAPPPFTELASYSGGGTLTETNTILNANSATLVPGLPFNASDGHGQWERENSNFVAKFRKLVFDTSGHYVANADITEAVTISTSDTDKFTGTFTIQFTFLTGSVPPVCSSGSLTAQRIHPD